MNDKPEEIVGGGDDLETQRLRQIMGRLLAILREENLAGHLVIACPGTSHVRIHLEADWSCAKVDNDGSFTFDPNPFPDKNKVIAETANVIHMLADQVVGAAQNLDYCDAYLSHEYGLTHEPISFTPDTHEPKVN